MSNKEKPSFLEKFKAKNLGGVVLAVVGLGLLAKKNLLGLVGIAAGCYLLKKDNPKP